MNKSINGWTFPAGTALSEVIELVRSAGFEAFEPTLDQSGELSVTTDESTCRALGNQIRAAGLDIASLACGLFWQASYTSPDAADRARAMEWTIAGLDRARWLGTDVLLVVPGLVSHFERPTRMVTGYAQALDLTRSALRELAPAAKARGVVLAIENVWNQFLLSPLEMRDLVDRVNSPYVRVYFDVGNSLKFGFPQDWINILGNRIVRVHLKDFRMAVGTIDGFCPLGDGDADWPAVIAALKAHGYRGPLTYEGPGDLRDIARRIDRILA
jgi:hexulose-6-phosphate isomerase